MKRLSAILLVLALAALLFAAANAAASAPLAQLRGFGCDHALDPPSRAISVKAVMRPMAGTVKMQLRFELWVTPDGPSAAPVMEKQGDLGKWKSPPNPTLGQLSGDVWNFTKSVVGLGVPATYQFRVDFRWIGAGGRVIGSAIRRGWRCHLIELRPDLLVQSPIGVTPVPGKPNQDLYTPTIDNNGATAAGPFVVQFVPADGSPPQTVNVKRLPAFAWVTVPFTGPLCTAQTAPTIAVDSTSEVDDLDRANNSLAAACPAPTPTSSAAGAHVGG